METKQKTRNHLKALLIIDMQLGSFRPYSSRHDTFGTIKRINALAQRFRDNKYSVVHIQHDGSKENSFLPGSDDWRLLPELETAPTDLFVGKTANDAFYRSRLRQILEAGKIRELYVTGCATDFCVDSTIKAALSKDYKITVVADGHTTANRPDLDAVAVIKYYNWLWSEMTPTSAKILVAKSADLLI